MLITLFRKCAGVNLLPSDGRRCALRLVGCAIVLAILLSGLSLAAPLGSPPTVSIDTDIHPPIAVRPHIFGIHGELLWSPMRLGEDRLADFYEAVGFSQIRLPGGTTANYYRWAKPEFSCQPLAGVGFKSKQRILKFNTALSKKNRTYASDDFIAFLKQTHTDVSLVINVLCGKPAETLEWMRFLKARGLDVRMVELGNELYFPEYAWRFPHAQAYLTEAAQHARAVRQVFPDARIGIIVSSYAFTSRHFPNIAAMKRVPREQRGLEFDTLAASAAFADAMVVHLYSRPGVSVDEADEGLIPEEQIYRGATTHFDARFAATIDYLKKIDPSKEIWVSEWGITFWGYARQIETVFKRGALNALFCSNALMRYLTTDSLSATNYHNFPDLFGFGRQGPTWTPTAVLLQLFADPLKEAATIRRPQFVGAGKDYGGQDHADLATVYLETRDGGYLFVLNKFNHRYRLTLNPSRTPMPKIDTVVQYHAVKTPSAAYAFEANKNTPPPGQGISIPPYSLTRIHYKLP